MNFVPKSKLPRLAREFYRGPATVLWTHTMEERATGWLDDPFHARFREILLHACGRFQLVCPTYVLMPDHWHLVWMGLTEESDQYLATAFLRKHLKSALGSARLQDRAHDHVLREKERECGAFQAACAYVLFNPERASLCQDWRAWPHLGTMIPGYPELDPRSESFWDSFWKIHNRLVDGPANLVARRVSGGILRSAGDPSGPNSPRREPRDLPPLPALTRRATMAGGIPRSPEDPSAHAEGHSSPRREPRDLPSNPSAHAQGYMAT
jgi:putative transposase